MNRTFSCCLCRDGCCSICVRHRNRNTARRAPKSGQPDLQGVWNFTSRVPLQRPAAFGDKKFFTKEEFDKQRDDDPQRAGRDRQAGSGGSHRPRLDGRRAAVDDLRTSLITYPENGRLPALVKGVRRMPGIRRLHRGARQRPRRRAFARRCLRSSHRSAAATRTATPIS